MARRASSAGCSPPCGTASGGGPMAYVRSKSRWPCWASSSVRRVVGRLLLPHLPGVAGPGNSVPVFGLPRSLFGPGFFSGGPRLLPRPRHLLDRGVLFFVAPWAMRAVVDLDRRLMGLLLGARCAWRPGCARSSTPGPRPSTRRRPPCGGSNGTSTTAPRPSWWPWPCGSGMAKEKLARREHLDLDQVRRLVDDAHRGAKEAIVELRDLARGIHPPALDSGSGGGALHAGGPQHRSPPSSPWSSADRPTPAIEAIAYFCVAELLANVAQHAQASRAGVTCAQHGAWLRVVVRDDGRAGPRPVAGRLVVERPGRPDRPGARRRRASRHREPAAAARPWSPWTSRSTPDER